MKFLRPSFYLFCMALCACTPDISGKPLADVTFAHLTPVRINVGALKTQDAEQPFSEEFVISPARTFDDYLHARFLPAGFSGALSARVEEAAVVHQHEQSETSVGRYLDVGGMDAYKIVLKLRLEHLGTAGEVLYGTVLSASRTVRVSEHSSIAERERAQMAAIEKLFIDLDKEILRIVLTDMGLQS